jgi:DNA-binding NarL/FixJ family response regulator
MSGEPDLARKASELGVAGYLRKPVKVEDLLSAVHKLAPL